MTRFLACLCGFCAMMGARGADPKIVATVNGEAIPLADVDALLARHKPKADTLKILRQAVLDELIDETLLRQYLDKHAPKVDAKEIDGLVAALVAEQKKRGQSLAEYLKETGLSEPRLRESFASMLRLNKFIAGRTTESEYKSWFSAHRDAVEGTKIKLAHIVLRLKPEAPDGEVAAVRTRLAAIKGEIDAGKITFEDAAKRHSIDVTAKLGGELGWIAFADGRVDPALCAAAFQLPVNGVSEPVRSPAGFHLLRVVERKAGPQIGYEQCAVAVREAYVEETRSRLVAKLRSEADLKVSLP